MVQVVPPSMVLMIVPATPTAYPISASTNLTQFNLLPFDPTGLLAPPIITAYVRERVSIRSLIQ